MESVIQKALFPLAPVAQPNVFQQSIKYYELQNPSEIGYSVHFSILLTDGREIKISEGELYRFKDAAYRESISLRKKKIVPRIVSEEEFLTNRLRVFLLQNLNKQVAPKRGLE